jgi:hypothetical protein
MRFTPTERTEEESIVEYLTRDHDRLEELLHRTRSVPGLPDVELYNEFRRGLLRHIGIEEKLLVPYVRNGPEEDLKQVATQLRLQHGAIASLLALDAADTVIEALDHILSIHNQLEEGQRGFYERCEALAGEQTEELRKLVREAPDVPLAIRAQTEYLFAAARRSLVRAGFPETLLNKAD